MDKEEPLPSSVMTDIYTETRNELITKIIKTLELKANEIAEIVELYYDCQTMRIAHGNKERTEPPSELVQWLDKWMAAGETVIKGKLAKWVESGDSPGEAKWAYEQVGIGPVIACGLAAYIDPAKAPTISSLWKYSGLAPGYDHKTKGIKLPYNARLKVLCFKIGESFVKVSNKEGATYGRLYVQFKEEEIRKNESGKYAAAAQDELTKKKFRNDTETKKRLLAGKLSDAHLHSRAKRKTVKIFLSHYWTKAREDRGLEVSAPYAIQILAHTGMITS